MRKFKLIKEYPGSPKLGTELTPKVDKENSNTNNFYWEGSWFNPKDFSEYWEEVAEKDYEILEYSTNETLTSKQILTKDMEGWDKIIESTTFKINSIKRLSDGEVFTVGDKIKANIGGQYVIRTIKEIQTEERGRLVIHHENGDLSNRKNSGIFHAIKKVKSPIFLTHDGKDIFAGDKVWYVNKKTFGSDYFVPIPSVTFFSDIHAYFLTREDAEDYIEKNKVIFTTEDGVDIKEGDTYYFVDTDFSIQTVKALRGAGQYSERKYFSTVEEAHEYVMQNVKALSIKDFWEITCMSTSNFNKSTYMKDLVKKTLGLK